MEDEQQPTMSAQKAVKQIALQTIQALATKYGFPVDEALAHLGFAKTRKRCEAPFSELMLAAVFCNPNTETYTKLNYKSIIATEAQMDEYKRDMETRTPKTLHTWFTQCKQQSLQFHQAHNITNQDTVTCYLTGKTITDPVITQLVQGIEKKQKKADIYFNIKNTETDNRWFGVSVKTTPNDPMSNWSIEKLITEQNKTLGNELKEIKLAILAENGITRNWRENKEENRKKYNRAMHGDNTYKSKLNEWITDPANKDYIIDIIASAVGSSIPKTKFKSFKYDGTKFTDLTETYKEIKETKTFTIIPDTPTTKELLTQKGLTSHHSETSAKLWYYIETDNKIKYRFEIRWKGEPFASPQILLINYTN